MSRARPADFPPAFDPRDYVAPPTDTAAERIDVGILIVGAGPAGLACAIRLGQLLEESPETAERLGEVPVAVLEKGKSVGAHSLSGAVVNPRALRRLFRDRIRFEEMPFYGPVDREGVYYLTKGSALRIPAPPTMRNDGNYIASLSELTRWLGEQAEAGGAYILPETAAEKLLVDGARAVGVRTGDKGRGRDGEPLPNFEPGSDVTAKVTVLAEGTQGHLTGVAMDRFSLAGENPQVWALGVKEIWNVPKPLHRIIHTMGWPLRGGHQYREFGGSFIYPMGDDMVTIGMVVGLDYRDAEVSPHDLLQQLKTHPLVRKVLNGGERISWGAKTIPEGGFVAVPQRLHAPGLLITGDGAGFVNVPALKGIHYAIESGRLAAEAAFAALQRGRTPWTPGALAAYDQAIRDTFICPQHAPAVRSRLLVWQRDGGDGDHELRHVPARQQEDPSRRRAGPDQDETRVALPEAGRQAHVRQALVRLPLREQNAGRRPEPHRAADRRARGGGADVGADVSRAGLRGKGGRRRRGHAVQLRPVRCDHRQGRQAHTARGRRRPRVQAHLARTGTRPSPATTSWQPERRSRDDCTGRRRSAPRRSGRAST
jgi:electron-transferring-flavoprotein dehydrogenase